MLYRRTLLIVCGLTAVSQMVAPAYASGLTGQQVIATFTNIALTGSTANNPAAGQSLYLDNTSTAVYTATNDVVNNNVASSSLVWGQFSGTNTGFLPFSDLVFVGNTIPANPGALFDVGSLTFLNGTSDLTSIIFGATMNFYAGSVTPGNFLGSDNIVVTTTSNIFGVPGGLTAGDDDYVNICGTFSTICGTSIEAVESSENGTGLVVELSGTIVGDPMMTISLVTLDPNQTPGANGFLGTDPPVGNVGAPEPGTLWLGIAAIPFAVFVARRRLAPAASRG